ncbi:unnamed protein product [Rotaria sp. Silwood1]|nr:unnamed protein product [Rotaria sp. Silwood1]
MQKAGSKQRREVLVHDGKCPSNHFPIHIHCRRRICRPQDLIPLCKSDGDCSTTQKCCRPMCGCRNCGCSWTQHQNMVYTYEIKEACLLADIDLLLIDLSEKESKVKDVYKKI